MNILASGKTEKEFLNLKTEWGGSKISSLLVHSPRGLAKPESGSEMDDSTDEEGNLEAERRLREAVRRGSKRMEKDLKHKFETKFIGFDRI